MAGVRVRFRTGDVVVFPRTMVCMRMLLRAAGRVVTLRGAGSVDMHLVRGAAWCAITGPRDDKGPHGRGGSQNQQKQPPGDDVRRCRAG